MRGCWWDPLGPSGCTQREDARAGRDSPGLEGFSAVEDLKNEASVEEQGRC